MEYFPAHSKQKMLERFEQETKRDSGNEFVECLVYSEESGVIMTGNQTDDAESDKVNISRFEPHRRHCVVVLEQDTFILA